MRYRSFWRKGLMMIVFILIPVAMLRAGSLTTEEVDRYNWLNNKPLQQFTNVELADYLQLRDKNLSTDDAQNEPADDVGLFATRAMGTVYRLNASRFDMGESDCITFVDRTIALALASDWRSYRLIYDRLVHKDGVVEYKNRNFSTLGDWLPNNSWLLEDVTCQLGSPVAKEFTHVVRPKVFVDTPAAPNSKYVKTVFKGSDYASGIQEVRTDLYIPRESIAEALPALRTGDVVLMMRTSSGGHLSCTHVGMVYIQDDGEISMISSSPSGGVRFDQLRGVVGYVHVRGLKFLRLRTNARSIVQNMIALSDGVSISAPDAEDGRVEKLRAKHAE